MRFELLVPTVLLLSAGFCNANTLNDVFGQAQNNCNYSAVAPYSACDVIGDEKLYDIQSATFSTNGGLATFVIYLNSGAVQTVNGQQTLVAFSDAGLILIPGDLFLYSADTVYDPSNPAVLQYGIAITSHGSFTAGDMYSIGGGVTLQTAQQALNNSSDYYRRDEDVLLGGSGSPVTSGLVSVSNYGNGVTNAEYAITVQVPLTAGMESLMSNGQIGILFSSADCGNDVIQGTVGTPNSQTLVATPEPGPALTMLTGILLLVIGSLWRKHSA